MAELDDDTPFDEPSEHSRRHVPDNPFPEQVLEPDPYFCPPAIPTLVHCLHCDEEYDSYLIEWREYLNEDGKREGFWCCPTPECDGIGFCFDIFPVDPEWRDEHGNKVWCDDEREYDDDEEVLDEFDDALTADEPDVVDGAGHEHFSPERNDRRPAPPLDEDIPF